MKTAEKIETYNEFRIAAKVEEWFQQLKPHDRAWVLLKLTEKYGARASITTVLPEWSDTARGPDSSLFRSPRAQAPEHERIVMGNVARPENE